MAHPAMSKVLSLRSYSGLASRLYQTGRAFSDARAVRASSCSTPAGLAKLQTELTGVRSDLNVLTTWIPACEDGQAAQFQALELTLRAELQTFQAKLTEAADERMHLHIRNSGLQYVTFTETTRHEMAAHHAKLADEAAQQADDARETLFSYLQIGVALCFSACGAGYLLGLSLVA